MKLAIKIIGYLLILSGLAWFGLSIFSTPETTALTFFWGNPLGYWNWFVSFI